MSRATALSIARSTSTAAASIEPCRILAVDYGSRRIGLALSDELQIIAQPLLTLARTNRRNDLHRLREICAKHSVARVLVGRPLHMTGKDSEMSEEAAQFARRLHRELGIEVELVDERLTSWEAAQIAARAKTRNQRSKASIDDVAAAVFLRDYLDRQRARAPHVPVER